MTLSFPSGRTAEEVVVDDAAGLAWIVNLGCIELHPHPVRTGDLDHPDELRIDLDPRPGVAWAGRAPGGAGGEGAARRAWAGRLAEDQRLARHARQRAHLIRAGPSPRCGARRSPFRARSSGACRAIATSKWWKEERHGVFLDYNQNAKDRTTCSAYSVRPLPDARVSAPLRWEEVPDCDPADFTVLTMPARFAAIGDPHAGMDAAAGSLETLLELAARDEAAGLGDAPWPPHFRKMDGEGPRVAPSRAKPAGAKPKAPRVKMPLIVIANSPDRDAALAGLERWKARHPAVVPHLAPDDVLVDSDARPLVDLDPHPGQPAPRARGGAPAPGDAGPR